MSNSEGVLPTGETASTPVGMLIAAPATVKFVVNIAPTTYNFQGRTVSETFPVPLNDGCKKNPNSPVLNNPLNTSEYPLVNGPNGEAFGTPVNGVTTGYEDNIGIPTSVVDEIRQIGDAPCTFTMTQDLWIDTATGTYEFQTNTNSMTINTDSLLVIRNGVPAEWTYISPAQKSFSSILAFGAVFLSQSQ